MSSKNPLKDLKRTSIQLPHQREKYTINTLLELSQQIIKNDKNDKNLLNQQTSGKVYIQNIKTDSIHEGQKTNSTQQQKYMINVNQHQQKDKRKYSKVVNSRNVSQSRHFTMINQTKLCSPVETIEDHNQDTFLLAFHSLPINTLKGQNQTETSINIRTFNSKFIRQLNFKQNQRVRKSRRKLQVNIKNKIAEIFDPAALVSTNNRKNNKAYNRKHIHQVWHQGIKVLAEFKNDVIHGQAQFFYPNGAKFQGKYEQGIRINGTFDFNNGYVYTGGFIGDKFHGDGQLRVPTGKLYSGEWVQNKLVGKTQIKYPTGDVYYGQTKQFKKHGKGYLFFKNGDKYVGNFVMGQICGKGEYFVEQKMVGRGYWKNGQLVKVLQTQNNQLHKSNDSNNSFDNSGNDLILQASGQKQGQKQRGHFFSVQTSVLSFENDEYLIIDQEEELRLYIPQNKTCFKSKSKSSCSKSKPKQKSKFDQKQNKDPLLLLFQNIISQEISNFSQQIKSQQNENKNQNDKSSQNSNKTEQIVNYSQISFCKESSSIDNKLMGTGRFNSIHTINLSKKT